MAASLICAKKGSEFVKDWAEICRNMYRLACKRAWISAASLPMATHAKIRPSFDKTDGSDGWIKQPGLKSESHKGPREAPALSGVGGYMM